MPGRRRRTPHPGPAVRRPTRGTPGSPPPRSPSGSPAARSTTCRSARPARSTARSSAANVFTRFNAIIGVLFVIIVVVGPIQDGLFGFVIVANTAIGIVQELRAKRTLDGLAVIGEAQADGAPGRARPVESPPPAIVLGDLIELGPGDKVVVDGEVVEADGLEIDESLLTGEADPVLKHPGDPVMSGSFVVAGAGAFTATKVGREAYAAQLAEEATRFTLVHSELRSGISQILKYVTWMMIPTAIGLIVSQLYVEGNDWREAVAPDGRRDRADGPRGAGAADVDRLRDRRRPAGPQAVPGPGAARDRGAGPGRRRLPGQDRHAHRGRHGRRRAAGAGRRRPRRTSTGVLAALGAADPRPNASLQAIIDAYPATAPRGGAPRAALPFSSARKYSGAALSRSPGPASRTRRRLAARRARRAAAAGPPGARRRRASSRDAGAAGAAAGPRRRGAGRPGGGRGAGAGRAGGAGAAAAAGRGADTLRYFAEQDVAAKVISGDNAVSVGAVAGEARRCPARNGRWTRGQLPAERGRAGRGPRGHARLRPGHPAAEARHGGAPCSPAATSWR